MNRYNIMDDVVGVAFLVVFVGGVLGLIYVGVSALDRQQCMSDTADLEIPHRWNGLMAGCQVKIDGIGWVSTDNWRVMKK